MVHISTLCQISCYVSHTVGLPMCSPRNAFTQSNRSSYSTFLSFNYIHYSSCHCEKYIKCFQLLCFIFIFKSCIFFFKKIYPLLHKDRKKTVEIETDLVYFTEPSCPQSGSFWTCYIASLQAISPLGNKIEEAHLCHELHLLASNQSDFVSEELKVKSQF